MKASRGILRLVVRVGIVVTLATAYFRLTPSEHVSGSEILVSPLTVGGYRGRDDDAGSRRDDEAPFRNADPGAGEAVEKSQRFGERVVAAADKKKKLRADNVAVVEMERELDRMLPPTGAKSNRSKIAFLTNNEKICGDDVDVFLLVYVHSAPENYVRRLMLRGTWAARERSSDVSAAPIVRVVFVMGRHRGRSGDDLLVQEAVELEAEQFGDIVQADFTDGYWNLTYKGLAALRWVTTYCRRARFVMKTDDDTLVNVPSLLRHLVDVDRIGQARRLVLCRTWWKMHVLRADTKPVNQHAKVVSEVPDN